MKKLLTILIFILTTTLSVAQVNYQSHRVVKGETIYSITKQYDVSEADLLLLNPEIKEGLKENTILIVPVRITTEKMEDTHLTEHKVKRKETLYSISKQYDVSIDDIKKYNKHLYADETLKRGETLKIPAAKVVIVTNVIPAEAVTPEDGKHTVQAKETKFGIAKMYGITIQDLEKANPVIEDTDNLPMGLILNIPTPQKETESASEEDENFILYEVKPKEGFFRIKTMFGISEEETIALNPHAKDGLKEGMILKIPRTKADAPTPDTELVVSSAEVISLEYDIRYKEPKNIALVLPFELNVIELDSLKKTEHRLLTDASLRLALDFYNGAMMAVETAKERGLSVNLYVIDSREFENNAVGYLRQKNIPKPDLIIGPLRHTAVEKVAADLQQQDIPVLSPLSNRYSRFYPNYIHSTTPGTILENEMLQFLKTNANGKNIILIADASKSAQRQKLQAAFPGLTIINPREGNYFRNDDIGNKIDQNRENWVILESTSATAVNSAIGILNSLNKDNNIRLFTTDRNEAFSFGNISNMHLANLNFTFPSGSKSYKLDETNLFLINFKEKFGIAPNRFSIRGFDVTYDALLRLAYAGNFMDALDSINAATEYTENKFFYIKNGQGGYMNQAAYILKYNQDLELDVVQ
jgi:LysM repeat protein